MPPWDQLPRNALQLINHHLGNPGIPVVLGRLALLDEQDTLLTVDWQTTDDVIFVGDVWTPGYHARVFTVHLGDRAVSLRQVPIEVSIVPGHVFTQREVGQRDVVLTVQPGYIRGIAHRGYRGVKHVTVQSHSKEVKGKNASDKVKNQMLLEQATMCFLMTASANKAEPSELPLELFSSAFYLPIYNVLNVANQLYNKDHYSTEAMTSEDLQDCPAANELRLLRAKLFRECDSVMNKCNCLLEFLEIEDIESSEKVDEKSRKKGVVYTRKAFLVLYEKLEFWAVNMPNVLSHVERLFRLAKIGSEVDQHTVGSLFMEGAKAIASIKFTHHKGYFELDNPREGLETLKLLDVLMAKMNEYAERLEGKVGDGIDVSDQGIRIIQMLEQARTEILLVASTCSCSTLKAALLDPAGPFCTMFNRLSAQSCSDKRENLWGKFIGWWKDISEGTRKYYG